VPAALLADAATPWPPSLDEGTGVGRGLLRYGTDYVAPQQDVLERHLAYQDVIDHAYALRGSGQGALAVAVAASQRQIALAAEAAAAFQARADEPLPEHRGYTVLATVRENQGSFDEALRLSDEAAAAGWAGDWHGRAERLHERIARRSARDRS
jgi:hypothetical protein